MDRLQKLDALVKELSKEDDPERLLSVFSRHANLIMPRAGVVTVTRRDLPAPQYRITRAARGESIINPETAANQLPVLDRGLLGDLLYAGAPLIVNRLEVAADDPGRKYLEGMGALACAPGYEHGLPLYLVAICRREPDSFTPEDLEQLLLNANLLGRAVNNLSLTQQLQEAYRALEQEKAQVGRVQRHLLPAKLPHIDGLELGAAYETSSRAGGDYYDVLPLPEEQWGLFMADVSGHGTPAAVVMAMIHTLLHSFPGPPLPPAHVFSYINRHLLAIAPEGMFATAFYGVYDPYYRRLRYANAGHPPPRLRRGTGAIACVDGAIGLPLGVDEQDSWNEVEATLVPGDVLLLYTDGIVEGMNDAGEPFGTQRLDHALLLGPLRATTLVKHLERHYKAFCNGTPDMDDRTLLAAIAVP
jgi:sigma-B regulation protein RsbU (phosphoserine phosphatase)